MKHIFMKLVPVFLLFGLISSCKNQDWSFPDYKYSTTYFPYQSPVRTLVLGNYDLADNTKDNNLQFSIGITMGGVYENTKDIKIGYVLDEALARNLYTDKGDTLVALPQAYYTLSPTGTVTIPKGEFQGYIDVQLTEAFLNDPRSCQVRYVVPLKLTSADNDSILQGKPAVPNPDPRVASDWVYSPKNFTLFGIKYINPYHGKYLLRGKDVVKDGTGAMVDQVVYHSKYVEDNAIWHLKTISRTQVEVTGMVRKTSGSLGNFQMIMTFSDDGNCTLTQTKGTTFPITGTGKFVKNADEWGGKKRDAIYLSYQITDTSLRETHHVNDTLVIRDRDVRLETFNPVVKQD